MVSAVYNLPVQLGFRNIFRRQMCSISVPMNVTKTKISPKLVLCTVDTAQKKPKPLVLFFPWLYATPSAVEKYCRLYHNREMDVLCVDVELKHFLRPSTGRKFAVEILDYLKEYNQKGSDFVVHAFSIGAYLYSIFLMEMEKNMSAYGKVNDKIRGQVFDSITIGGLDRMSEGIAQFTQNTAARTLLKAGTATYFKLTKKHTVDFYEATIHQFREKPLKTPVLLFYCLNDPMASAEAIEDIIKLWRGEQRFNMDVQVKCWEKSSHAGHLRRYPEEYTRILQDFLVHIGQSEVASGKSKL